MEKIYIKCIEVYYDTEETLIEHPDGSREIISLSELDLINPIVYH